MRGIGSLNNAGVYGLAFWASLSEAAVLGNIRMVITTGGNVGIGTTGPQNKLDVNGGILAYGILNSPRPNSVSLSQEGGTSRLMATRASSSASLAAATAN